MHQSKTLPGTTVQGTGPMGRRVGAPSHPHIATAPTAQASPPTRQPNSKSAIGAPTSTSTTFRAPAPSVRASPSGVAVARKAPQPFRPLPGTRVRPQDREVLAAAAERVAATTLAPANVPPPQRTSWSSHLPR